MAAVPSIGRAAGVERRPDAGVTQELYERYSAQIYGFCVNRLGSRDEAEDATQSTFLNAHRALQRGVTPEAELAWLFKIAHNVCLTRRRSSFRRNRVESPSDLGAVQDVLPAPTRESSDELIRLTDALSHMPDNQRRAILLREWQGLSYHEIADDLKVSQSAVETLIFRARRALASNLEREQGRPRVLGRVRKALDVGTLLAALKGLFATSAAVKATAAAVAVSGAVVIATDSPAPTSKPAAQSAPVVAKAPTRPVVVSAEPRTAPPAPAGRPSAVARDRNPSAAARAKRADKPVPPGQARKAAAVGNANGKSASKVVRASKPVRARPAVTKRPVAVSAPKVAKAKPARTPKRATVRAVKPKGLPAAAVTGAGNGKGAGKSDD